MRLRPSLQQRLHIWAILSVRPPLKTWHQLPARRRSATHDELQADAAFRYVLRQTFIAATSAMSTRPIRYRCPAGLPITAYAMVSPRIIIREQFDQMIADVLKAPERLADEAAARFSSCIVAASRLRKLMSTLSKGCARRARTRRARADAQRHRSCAATTYERAVDGHPESTVLAFRAGLPVLMRRRRFIHINNHR